MSRRLSSGLATFLICGLSLGCGDDGTGPSQGFTVSGSIQNNTGSAIPTGTRVVVVWLVSAATPDYTYVFGEGSLDPGAGTFQVRFDQAPPVEALNNGGLGVGIVVVTTDGSLGIGDDINAVSESEIIGAAGQYAVIHVSNPEAAEQFREWATDFEAGYGVGVGVEVSGAFDEFEPASPSGVVLTIDDLDNIEFVDWT